jgi:uncharacterized protein
MSGRPPWRITDTGLDLRIRLTPRAVHDLIDGVTETATGAAVRVWVRALPEAGRANDAVEGLVAAWLEVPKTHVHVSTGTTSRVKMLAIDGDGLLLARKLADWLGRASQSSESAMKKTET